MKKGLVVVGALSSLLTECSMIGSSAKEISLEVQEISAGLLAESTILDTTQTTDRVTFTVIQHLSEGPYRSDEEGQSVPGLAEEAVISEDGRTYTFKLKEEAKWNDGQ